MAEQTRTSNKLAYHEALRHSTVALRELEAVDLTHLDELERNVVEILRDRTSLVTETLEMLYAGEDIQAVMSNMVMKMNGLTRPTTRVHDSAIEEVLPEPQDAPLKQDVSGAEDEPDSSSWVEQL